MTITATFGALQMEVGSLGATRLFLFVLGATSAFAVIESATSRFFRQRVREERSDVVLLGTTLAPFSVTAALGAGVGVLQVVGGTAAWFLTPAPTTAVYVGLAGAQLSFARQHEKRHPPEK